MAEPQHWIQLSVTNSWSGFGRSSASNTGNIKKQTIDEWNTRGDGLDVGGCKNGHRNAVWFMLVSEMLWPTIPSSANIRLIHPKASDYQNVVKSFNSSSSINFSIVHGNYGNWANLVGVCWCFAKQVWGQKGTDGWWGNSCDIRVRASSIRNTTRHQCGSMRTHGLFLCATKIARRFERTKHQPNRKRLFLLRSVLKLLFWSAEHATILPDCECQNTTRDCLLLVGALGVSWIPLNLDVVRRLKFCPWRDLVDANLGCVSRHPSTFGNEIEP